MGYVRPLELVHVRKTVTFLGGSANAAVTTAAGYLQDTRQSMTVNAWVGYTINCDGKTGVVTSNTATRLNVASWTGGTPTTGSAWTTTNAGAVGTFPIFTLTGNVALAHMYAYATALVTGGVAHVKHGTAADSAGISPVDVQTLSGYTGFVSPGYADAGGGIDLVTTGGDYDSGHSNEMAIGQSIIGEVVTAALTGGTIRYDAWYRPFPGGSLVAS